MGIDLVLDGRGDGPDVLADRMAGVAAEGLEPGTIAHRGVEVGPGGVPDPSGADHWRCRFLGRDGGAVGPGEIVALLHAVRTAGLEVVAIRTLRSEDRPADGRRL